MAIPWAAVALGQMLGSGKGVEVNTTQQVNQSSNTNVNPIIAVQTGTPGAHFDQNAHLDPVTSQYPSVTYPQAQDGWRLAMPGGFSLPGEGGSEFGPFAGDGDTKQPAAGANRTLSALLNPTTILVLGGGLLLWLYLN